MALVICRLPTKSSPQSHQPGRLSDLIRFRYPIRSTRSPIDWSNLNQCSLTLLRELSDTLPAKSGTIHHPLIDDNESSTVRSFNSFYRLNPRCHPHACDSFCIDKWRARIFFVFYKMLDTYDTIWTRNVEWHFFRQNWQVCGNCLRLVNSADCSTVKILMDVRNIHPVHTTFE